MYYNQIIDNDDQLIYLFIQLFIERNTEKMSLAAIREALQISPHKLLQLFEATQNLSARLNTFSLSVNKKECLLETESAFSLQDIYTELVKSSVGFKLLEELLESPLFSLENFAQKNFMSTRTIYRKITGLSGCLDNYHLSLNLRKKHPVSGDEYFIRYFYHFLYWQLYGPAKTYDCLTDSQVSELDHLLTEHYPYYRNIDRSRWLHYFDLSLKRIRNGFYLYTLPDEINGFKNVYMTFSVFKKRFIDPAVFPNKADTSVRENEARLLYYLLSVTTTYSFEESRMLHAETPKISAEVQDMVLVIVEMVEKLFRIQASDAEIFFLELNIMNIHSKSHIYAAKNRADIFGMRSLEPKLAEFFPAYYFKVKKELLASPYSDSFQQLYQENERLFFIYCLLIREILDNHGGIPFRIFLQAKPGKLQEEWQKRRVRDVIDNNICIQFVDNEQEADLILTDYVVKEKQEAEKYYHWQTKPTAKDWKYITNYITQFQKKYLGF
ncbi:MULTISPECIES: helix-turn-helix domain-containing protein [unclassified Enterococcus]|jgi:hypothetical protein|uniref:helix-turn-helix domain-containing protein n=1 Tax=unclassified Enterococcus TaxID=2608891 RepID=UPI003D28B5AE